MVQQVLELSMARDREQLRHEFDVGTPRLGLALRGANAIMTRTALGTRQTHVCRSLVFDQGDRCIRIPSSNRLNHRVPVSFIATHKQPNLALANAIHQSYYVPGVCLMQSCERLLGIPRPAFVVGRCDNLE